jgi:peroxiredoxin
VTEIFYLSYAALWILVVFQTLILLGVVRAVYRTSSDVDSESPHGAHEHLAGHPAPRFAAVDVLGKGIDDTVLSGQQTVLLFVSPDCRTCAPTLHELEALKLKVSGSVLIVCRAGREECVRLAESYRLAAPPIADDDLKLSRLFGVRVTPTAVLIDADGRIQSYGHPMRGDELVALMAEEIDGSAMQGAV